MIEGFIEREISNAVDAFVETEESLEEYQVFSILSDYLCNKDAVTAAKSLDSLKLSKKTIKGYMPDIQKEIAGVYAAAKQTEESE